jgi:hypothetical protein
VNKYLLIRGLDVKTVARRVEGALDVITRRRHTLFPVQLPLTALNTPRLFILGH